MHTYIWSILVTVLAIILSVGVGFFVGAMRVKTKLDSPAMSGHIDLEKALRVQYNTLEQYVIFMPALWIFAYVVSDVYAGILGAVWLFGRLLYATMYFNNPKSRELGYALTLFPTLIMAVWTLVALWR